MDEVLGAVAVSLRREKVPQTSMMGSANGNQSETFIQVSTDPNNFEIHVYLQRNCVHDRLKVISFNLSTSIFIYSIFITHQVYASTPNL